MTQLDKLISRITSLSGDVRFEELKRILEREGYTMSRPRGGSSHCTFRKHGFCPITVPKRSPVKVIYVAKVKKVLEGKK